MIIQSDDSPYEPAEGGLGFEMFRSLTIHEEKIAQIVIETGEIRTYGDLLIRSKRVALYLQSKNLKKEDVVCLCSHNQADVTIPFIASKFIDVNYASVEPTMPEEDLIYLLNYAKPKVLFVTEQVEEKIEKCLEEAGITVEIIIFGKSKKYKPFDEIIQPNSEEENFTPVFIKNLHETALIFFSSGTTGKPKGICSNHYSLLSQAFNMNMYLYHRGTCDLSNIKYELGKSQNGTETSLLIYSPLYWVSGIAAFLSTIILGCRRLIGSVYTSEKTWKALQDYKVNFLFLPPGQIADLYMGRSENTTSSLLEVITTGGGPVKPIHMEYIKEMFPNSKAIQLYGMTEMSSLMSTFDVKDPASVELQQKYTESCGKITHGITAKIVDLETEETLGYNQQGELRIKSKYLMNGYYKIDASSAYDSEGWFKTGDLAFFNEHKCLIIIDRIKELILYTLYNIRPSVIEEILAKHPAVRESCVIGFPHIKDNEHPMGIVALKKEYRDKVTAEEILTFVNEKVPADRFKIRAGIKIVKELKKTVTGKIKKPEIKRLVVEGKI